MRTFLFLAITLLLLGAVLTMMLWPHRTDPRTRRLLAVLWAFIGVAIPLAALAAITSVGVSALYIFDLLSERLRTAGVPKLLAQGIAAIGVLPILLGLVFVFLRGGSKRYVGVGILSASAAAYFFTSYAFARRHDGYVILADNTLDYCDSPGETDQPTLKPCRAMTPEVLHLLSRTRRDETVSVFDWPPPDQILDTDGKPQRWYCPRPNGSYVFAVAPIYDPVTGRKCKAPTRAVIERYREEQRNREPTRGSSTAPEHVRQDLTKAIHLPFREDFMDGEFDALNAVGDWNIEQSGEIRGLCANGIGPWSFRLMVDSVPLHELFIRHQVRGEGWQSRVVYTSDTGKTFVAAHNWRDRNESRSYVRGINQGQTNATVQLSSEWYEVTLRMEYDSGNEHWGWDRYRQRSLYWYAFLELSLVYDTRLLGNGRHRARLAAGPVVHEQGKQGVKTVSVLLWPTVTHLIRSVEFTFRQPFDNQFCLASIEVSNQRPERFHRIHGQVRSPANPVIR